ncbi:MAG: phosphate acyltransferase PlsX [Bacteroidia bacterium]|jgi:glycerol-3-phosphate acyltransferase PlsX|nr:phosphate acyltransferase PlsX [Bacteroidia bacterium]
MKIGFDIMGGDYAPSEAIKGAILAKNDLPTTIRLVLIGDQETAKRLVVEHGGQEQDFDFVHTTEVIEMGEHPTKAISQKRNSSIAVGFGMLAAKEIDAFVSAGNTGAMLVGAMFSVKPIEGVIRPCITATVPKPDGKTGLLLDVGVNADCKPDVLFQFGVLGSLMMQHVMGVQSPRVGLMSIGEEKEKGNLVTIAAHQMMESGAPYDFVGNVEGRDMLTDKCDVIVCEGFVGNVILKAYEAFYYVVKKRGSTDPYLDRFNYENYGGTPILGVNAPVIIGHGISNAKAFKNMIFTAKQVTESNLCTIIKDAFKNIVLPVQ